MDELSAINIRVSYDGRYFHAQVMTTGTSADRARDLAARAMGWLTDGKEAFVRAHPSGETVTDANTGRQIVRGYARFSFEDPRDGSAPT